MLFERLINLFTPENLLILVLPLLAILYRVIKQFGVWDKLTSRDKAMEGLKRLRSTAGYPVSFIYDNQQDNKVFEALFQRMKRHCRGLKIRSVLDSGSRPYIIATAGEPIEIKGIPPDWSQEARFFYPDNQPILMMFKSPEAPDETQSKNYMGDKVCTLGELDTWLSEEKDQLDFCIGVILFGTVSIFITIIRIIIIS